MAGHAGHKQQLDWFHNYIVAVLSSPGQQDYPPTYALQIFDLRNKLIAISVPLPDVSICLQCRVAYVMNVAASHLHKDDLLCCLVTYP